jgi:hypothetical protein
LRADERDRGSTPEVENWHWQVIVCAALSGAGKLWLLQVLHEAELG